MLPTYAVSEYVDDGRDLTDPSLYRDRDADDAPSLPPFAYRSAVFAALEDERVWTPAWVCVGTTADVPDAGDLLPYTVGAQAIHVRRAADGALFARYNKAQHGGCRFVPLQCRTGAKTHCSFTCCAYSRDRATIKGASLTDTAPETYQYIGLRPERLPPAPLAQLGALLFVNLDPAGPRAHGLAGVAAALPWLPAADAPRQDATWHEAGANWKLLAHHLAAQPEAGARCLDEALDGGWRHARSFADDADSLWLFPNLLILRAARGVCVVVLQPTAVEKTRMRISLYADQPGQGADAWLTRLRTRAADAEAAQAALPARRAALPAPGGWLARQVTDHVLTPHPGYQPAVPGADAHP